MSEQALVERGSGASVAVAKRGRRWRARASRVVLLLFMVGFGILSVIPIWWMAITGLESSQDFYALPPTLWPSTWDIGRIPQAWEPGPDINFTVFLGNTLFITVLVVFGSVLSGSIAAYGFARLRFPGRGVLFAMMLATMMLPAAVTVIPTFLLFKAIGWIDTFKPLIVPAFFGNAFNIFLLRQFYLSIPYELEEATRIDGGGAFTIWWRIMIPLSGPALASIAIFSFIGSWNEFFSPLIFLNTTSKFTIQLALHLFQGEYGGSDLQGMMAVAFLATLPCILIFFFFQRYFIRGIVTTGFGGR
jgi:ABC-type glycerol-3-phosphate transport system permease component